MTMQDDGEHGGREGAKAAFSDPETFCQEVEAYIRERPFQSLGIALLAGLIFGKIIL